MRLGAVLAIALVAPGTSLAGAAPSAARVPLAVRLSEVATGFCVDVLSRKVGMPENAADQAALFAGYGLTQGISNDGRKALGRDSAVISRAILASGEASDGSFMIALGGRAGQTCRLLVYRAPLDALFVWSTYAEMQKPAHLWRKLPPPAQPPQALKLSLVKRDAARQPYLANILAPVGPDPIAATVIVAAIPADVAIPEGF